MSTINLTLAADDSWYVYTMTSDDGNETSFDVNRSFITEVTEDWQSIILKHHSTCKHEQSAVCRHLSRSQRAVWRACLRIGSDCKTNSAVVCRAPNSVQCNIAQEWWKCHLIWRQMHNAVVWRCCVQETRWKWVHSIFCTSRSHETYWTQKWELTVT